MDFSRRRFGAHVTGSAVGAALAACGAEGAPVTPSAVPRPAVLLMHGAWLGAWCYGLLVQSLQAQGVNAFTIDLPGHSLSARFPTSFLQRPLDAATFSTEGSPLAALTLNDYVDVILAEIDRLTVLGFGPITLLGHSMAGIPITAVAERASTKVAKLIYLSAFMTVTAVPAVGYLGRPENRDSQTGALLMADPTQVGALRLDTATTDASYGAALKKMFCGDLSDEGYRAVAHLMQPDDPASPFGTPTGATTGNWGRVPRTYIGCTEDKVIPPALQQLFVAEADGLAPSNKTDFVAFESSHTPFFSKPEALASVIAAKLAT
jgi:pimeloyl-ACP methyl ester carboxylesterase